MKKGAILYVIRLLAERFIGALLFYVAAGGFDTRSGIFFSVCIITAAISGIIIYNSNPETLSERGKVNTNSPKWDKVLLSVFWVCAFFFVYFIAGLTVPLGMEIEFDFVAGIVIYLFSAWITLKALLENTFLESTARLQPDRNQTVIQTGLFCGPTPNLFCGFDVVCCGKMRFSFGGSSAAFANRCSHYNNQDGIGG